MSGFAAAGFPLPVFNPKQFGLGFNKTSQNLCFHL
jgi:hypothetical protein